LATYKVVFTNGWTKQRQCERSAIADFHIHLKFESVVASVAATLLPHHDELASHTAAVGHRQYVGTIGYGIVFALQDF
jgi:hypothetical protein